MLEKYEKIESIVCRDVGRNIKPLLNYTKNNLFHASKSLTMAKRVGLITGFYIPRSDPPAAETDGPLGTILLAAGLKSCGIDVQIATDSWCEPVIQTAINFINKDIKLDVIGNHNKSEIFEDWELLDHVISIERPGISNDGKPHNMLGNDISDYTVILDDFYSMGDWTKIAIGDGGNEIGMGNIPKNIIENNITNGSQIACVTKCDHLIVAGVSNWGAYGLSTTLALINPEWKNNILKYLNPDLEFNLLKEIVLKSNAVDGTTARKEFTVDALEANIHAAILSNLIRILES